MDNQHWQPEQPPQQYGQLPSGQPQWGQQPPQQYGQPPEGQPQWGQQPPYYVPPQQFQQPPPWVMQQQYQQISTDLGSGQAIAGFILSLLGAFVLPILLIPAIILSIIGLRSTRQHGLALSGLIISIIFVVIWLLLILVIIIALATAPPTSS